MFTSKTNLKILNLKINYTKNIKVNTTSRRGIKGFLLVLFFFYFPTKVAKGQVHTYSSQGKSPAPAS